MGLDAVIAALQAVAISIEHGALKPPVYLLIARGSRHAHCGMGPLPLMQNVLDLDGATPTTPESTFRT